VNLTDFLSQELGESIPSVEAARKVLKKLKNSDSERGRLARQLGEQRKTMEDSQKETVAPAPRPDLEAMVKEQAARLEEMSFFSENPGLQTHKQTLMDLQKGTGKSLRDIANLESFKSVLTKAQAHDEAEKSKTVLQSNPRLGAAKDKMSEAREFAKAGDHRSAASSAVSAVLDAYALKG